MFKKILFLIVILISLTTSLFAESFEKILPFNNYWDIPKENIIKRSKELGWKDFYNEYKKELGINFEEHGSIFSGWVVPYVPAVHWMEYRVIEYTNLLEMGWAEKHLT